MPEFSSSISGEIAAIQRALTPLKVAAPEHQLQKSDTAIQNARKLVESLERANNVLTKIWEIPDSASRNAAVKDSIVVLFDAAHIAYNWVEKAYQAIRGDEGVLDVLHVLRVVPSVLADVLHRAKAGKDSDMQKMILELCLKNARMAGYGRRSGDIKTMHHILDSIFRLNKIKTALKKQGTQGLDQVTSEWLKEFQGGNPDVATAAEYGKQLLASKSQDEFMAACFLMISKVHFFEDEEEALSVPCSSVDVETSAGTFSLKDFTNEIGVGRFTVNIFGSVEDGMLWLNIPLWDYQHVRCTDQQEKDVRLESSIRVTSDLKAFMKENKVPLNSDSAVKFVFVLGYGPGAASLQECLQRRILRFSRGERVSVVREAVDVSVVASSTRNLDMAKEDQDFSQDPLLRRPKANVPKPSALATEDDGDVNEVRSKKNHQQQPERLLADQDHRLESVAPDSYTSKSTIRDLQAFALAYHPEVYKEFFGDKSKKPRKSDILQALDAACNHGAPESKDHEEAEPEPTIHDKEDTTPEREILASPAKPSSRSMKPVAKSDDEDEFAFPAAQQESAKKESRTRSPTSATSPPSKAASMKHLGDALTSKTEERSTSVANAARSTPRASGATEEDADEFDFLGSQTITKSSPKAKRPVSLEAAAGSAKRHLDAVKQQKRGLSLVDAEDSGLASAFMKQTTAAKSVPGKPKRDRHEELPTVPSKTLESTTKPKLSSAPTSKTPLHHLQNSTFVTPLVQAEVRSLISPPARPGRFDIQLQSKRRRGVLSLLEDDKTPTREDFAFAARKRLLEVMNKQTSAHGEDSVEEDNDEYDFESQDVSEDVILECDRSARAIRRVVQKVTARKTRSSKQIERRVRRVLNEASDDIDKINDVRQAFLAAFKTYESLIQAKKDRQQERERQLAERAHHFSEIRTDIERVQRELERLRDEAHQAAKRFAASLKENANKQLGEIQKMVQKQQKEAKEWRNIRA